MNIRNYQQNDRQRLFAYWEKVGTGIPYFFPVTSQTWQTCLLEDKLDGERLFATLETYLATEDDHVLGFVQWGQPNFAWDENGDKYPHPSIGVIRHLYFDADHPDIGEALLAWAREALTRFERTHAFYHIFGMSCNARHGKLHQSQSHVERLLLAYGFQIEHGNVYYVLDMAESPPPTARVPLHVISIESSHGQRFEARLNGEIAGTAHVRYLDAATGGRAHDCAYLTWIAVTEKLQSQGIGTALMGYLIQFLSDRAIRYLHTDTADSNTRAQQFYEKLGFQKRGYTRSYVT